MKKRRIVKVFSIFLAVFVFAEFGYSQGLFQMSSVSTEMPQISQTFLNTHSLIETAVKEIRKVLPGESTLLMSFDREIEVRINRAKIQRKFMMTAA